MKRSVAALIGLALLGGAPLLGQQPIPAPGTAGSAPMAAPVAGAPWGAVKVGAPAVENVSEVCEGSDASGHHHKTPCVPEEYVKTTKKPVYSEGSEPICLPYHFDLYSLFHHNSCQCDDAYTRTYLIKKIKTTEEICTKCVPVKCEHCGAAPDSANLRAMPRPPEPIPAPKPAQPAELIPPPGK